MSFKKYYITETVKTLGVLEESLNSDLKNLDNLLCEIFDISPERQQEANYWSDKMSQWETNKDILPSGGDISELSKKADQLNAQIEDIKQTFTKYQTQYKSLPDSPQKHNIGQTLKQLKQDFKSKKNISNKLRSELNTERGKLKGFAYTPS